MKKIFINSDASVRLGGGFTLIELLVVVLIVSILSVIALPQYQVAVTKSRTMQAIVSARAVKDAQELYYLSNGSYTDTLSDLPIEAGSSCTPDIDEVTSVIRCYLEDRTLMIQWFLDHQSQTTQDLAGQRWCFAYNKIGDQVCASFGGTTSSPAREGSSTQARTYTMP